jgi:hypothetical protein
VTPPLIPLSPPLTPFEPSESAGDLELLSDYTDPTIEEAEVLDEKLAKQDSIINPRASSNASVPLSSTEDFAQIYSPIRSILYSSFPAPLKKRKVADYKVEVPLTPPDQPPSTPAKKVKFVNFPEMLHEYIPQNRATYLKTEDAAMNSQASIDAFFDEIIGPIAIEADQSIEQEQLQEADSLLRVPIPVMDFSQPIAPWKIYARKANGKLSERETELLAQQKFLVQIKQLGLPTFATWSSVAKLERQLHWTAIPREIAKVAFEEKIGDDRYMTVILNDMGQEDVLNSDSLTWKLDGLRILDDLCESEDELEPPDDQEFDVSDVEETLRKRRLDLLGSNQAYDLQMESEPHPEAQRTRRPVKNNEDLLYRQAPIDAAFNRTSMINQKSTTVLGGAAFSASMALSNFMRTQGRLPMASTPLSRFDLQNDPVISEPPLPTRPTSGHDQRHESLTTSSTIASQKNDRRTTPRLPPDLDTKSFIISTALLYNRRPLVRVIGALYGRAILFERDFTALPTTLEADLILSPTTGIVLTTLQKIKQRSLPGQEGKPDGIEYRLSRLNDRYERLLVLIDEGLTLTGIPRDLDRRDCDALTELREFVRRFESDIQVLYVPGGNEQLGREIVSYMLRYGSLREEKELQEEDSWASHLSRSIFIYLSSNKIYSGNKHYVVLVSTRSQPKFCSPSYPKVSTQGLRWRTPPKDFHTCASKLLMT